jgi:hypothetical protein
MHHWSRWRCETIHSIGRDGELCSRKPSCAASALVLPHWCCEGCATYTSAGDRHDTMRKVVPRTQQCGGFHEMQTCCRGRFGPSALAPCKVAQCGPWLIKRLDTAAGFLAMQTPATPAGLVTCACRSAAGPCAGTAAAAAHGSGPRSAARQPHLRGFWQLHGRGAGAMMKQLSSWQQMM